MMGLFSFAGRTKRLAYLGVGLLQLVLGAGLIVCLALAVAMGFGGKGGAAVLAVLGMFACLIVFLWIGLAATVRRFRDMGWPPGYSMGAYFVLNFLTSAMLTPAALTHGYGQMSQGMTNPNVWASLLPQAGPWMLFSGLANVMALCLVFWPSARRANFDDIEAMFGGGDDDDLPPAPVRDPEPAFARPAFTAQPAQGFARVDPSQPRAQFGLRGVT